MSIGLVDIVGRAGCFEPSELHWDLMPREVGGELVVLEDLRLADDEPWLAEVVADDAVVTEVGELWTLLRRMGS